MLLVITVVIVSIHAVITDWKYVLFAVRDIFLMGIYVMYVKAIISKENVNFVKAQEDALIAKVNLQHANIVMVQATAFQIKKKMIMNKKISRRDLFKRMARILPVIVLSTSPIVTTRATKHSIFSCEGNCEAYCQSSCIAQCSRECVNTCSEGCKESCSMLCKGTCAYSCEIMCGRDCVGMCHVGCTHIAR